jgi:hypothetical protein
MFVAQFASRYTQLRYFCKISYYFQDLIPSNRDTSVQYKPCDLSADICKVVCRECHVAESKYVVSQGRDRSNISVAIVTELVGLPIDG